MPENWNKYKLKELTSKIGSGATPRGGKGAYKESGISLIRSQNVLDFSFSSEGLAFIDDDQAAALKNVTLESQDVLLNITGDSVARVCKVPDQWLPARVNQHVAIVRADEKLFDADFLLYSLLSRENKNLLLTMAGAGATRNALTKTMIEEFEISIPGIKEQKSIASILSALDDKIELNLQMNKTLEEMAMALYKHWFVDFGPFQDGEFVASELGEIPEGWKVKRLDDICEKIYSGGTPKTSKREYWGGDIPWLSSGETRSSYILDTEKKITALGLNKSSARMASKYDVVIASAGQGKTRGQTSLLLLDTAVNQSVLCLRAKKSEIHPLTLFCDLKNRYSEFRNISDSFSTRGSLTTKLIGEQIKLALPPIEIKESFHKNLEYFINYQETLLLENITLTQLRDTLLPKLISGEVRVKDVEKTLTEVL